MKKNIAYNKRFYVKEQLNRNKTNACQQPYHPKCTSFRKITEVKQLFSTWMGDHISTVYVLLAFSHGNPEFRTFFKM
jgi:hypothetical protein